MASALDDNSSAISVTVRKHRHRNDWFYGGLDGT
jgi:hypothetical protein